MTTYRFKFIKGEEVKFIGHLDVMQTFQRAIKRAELPIAYSQGFNPHQQISFAQPLSLGYTGTGEYGDFKLTENINAQEAMERLNEVLPCGLLITEIIVLKEGSKNTMASVSFARYKALLPQTVSPSDVVENIENFFKQEEIIVMKKTKKSFKDTDIKPDIIEVYNASEAEQAIIGMVVSAGSVRNLKPESVAEAFCNFIGKEYNFYKTAFIREDMYMEKDGEKVPLNFGVEE